MFKDCKLGRAYWFADIEELVCQLVLKHRAGNSLVLDWP